MKKFIIDLLKQFPISIGFVLLLFSCHLTGIKKLTSSWKQAPEVFWNILIVYFIVVYVYADWVRPTIEKEKRDSCTWTLILTSVVVLTLLANFFPK